MSAMTERSLGPEHLAVSAIGLGCMGMSDLYGPADRAESIATIHAALDAGITLIDTGDFYGMGHNELLIREALAGRDRDDVVISVKFGGQRDPAGAWISYDASPPAVKTSLAYSLTRLGVDHIDVYRPARLDADVPIEETVGAIAELAIAWVLGRGEDIVPLVGARTRERLGEALGALAVDIDAGVLTVLARAV